MQIKNYTITDTSDLAQMQAVSTEIAGEVRLTHSVKRSFDRMNEAKTVGAALRHFKPIVQAYYRGKANQWLDENSVEDLPSEFDEWDNVGGAAQAHVLQMAGIEVMLQNGFFTTSSKLL